MRLLDSTALTILVYFQVSVSGVEMFFAFPAINVYLPSLIRGILILEAKLFSKFSSNCTVWLNYFIGNKNVQILVIFFVSQL